MKTYQKKKITSIKQKLKSVGLTETRNLFHISAKNLDYLSYIQINSQKYFNEQLRSYQQVYISC